MTILQDEHKPTQPTPSDAVVELIGDAVIEDLTNRKMLRMVIDNLDEAHLADIRDCVGAAILSALSDAGLAVLPLEATDDMLVRWHYKELGRKNWCEMAAAFHPSQLEKTNE